jgi:hypothetical protein
MRKTIIFFIASFIYAGIATAQTDYEMLEIMYLKPKPDKMKELTKAMGEHNKKYHAEGPYGVSVWSCELGPHFNQLAWVMGPCTFTALDSRPDSKEHEDDWSNNVEPLIEGTGIEYWKYNKDLSYVPENYKLTPKVVWTVFDIKPFEGYRFKEMCKKIAEVYKAKSYPYNFQVYFNQFDSKEGRDVAIEVGFEKWAFFDRDENFKKDYEEIHGEGTFQQLLDEYRDVVVSVEDEVAEIIPEMSGTMN